MNFLTACVITLLCFSQVRATIYVEYVQCVEQRQCGLTSVCRFELTSPNKTGLLGYIMKVSNGLAQPINVTWDVLGGCTHGTQHASTLLLDDHSARFINTHCQGVHTIRLQVSNGTADTEIANPELVCSHDQACEYLVRSCFANNDDPLCREYADYCQAALKYTDSNLDIFRQACIPNCLSEFYGHTIHDPYRYKSDEIVNTMLVGHYNMTISTPEYVKIPLVAFIFWCILTVMLFCFCLFAGLHYSRCLEGCRRRCIRFPRRV